MSQAGKLSIEDGDLPGDVPIIFQTDSGQATAASHILNVLGGSGTTTSGAGNTIIVTVSGASFTWQIVTSADNPVNLNKENGYISKGAGVVNFVLPAASSVGDTYKIIGYSNLWTMAQNAGQSIIVGNKTTTLGIGGSIAATMVSDGITLVCITANSEFYEDGVQGNITVI